MGYMATSAYQGAGQPLYRAQAVELRQESEPLSGSLPLMRWVISDINRVLDAALTYRLLYASVLSERGLPGDGAWVLSTFALRDGWTPQRLAEGTNRREYQTVAVSVLLTNGYELWPTNVYMADGSPCVGNEVHYDVVIAATDTLPVPEALLDPSTGKAARKAARLGLIPHFEQAIALWDAPQAV